MILEGRSAELAEEIRKRMEAAAEEMHFELAARLRDRIRAIQALSNRQMVISTAFSDTDALAFCRGALCCFSVLHFINGDLAGKEVILIDEPRENDAEAAIVAGQKWAGSSFYETGGCYFEKQPEEQIIYGGSVKTLKRK